MYMLTIIYWWGKTKLSLLLMPHRTSLKPDLNSVTTDTGQNDQYFTLHTTTMHNRQVHE